MSPGFRRMAACAWPDSLFRRLGIILFAGLLAAHLLSFGLVAFNVFGPTSEVGDDYFVRYVATAVAILDRVKPEERPAWLRRLARPAWRYVVRDGGEIEAAVPKRRAQNLDHLRPLMGPGHTANSVVYLDPPNPPRSEWRVQLKDGTPLAIEYVAPRTVSSPWLPVAFAVQLLIFGFLTWIAVKLVTQPLAGP